MSAKPPLEFGPQHPMFAIAAIKHIPATGQVEITRTDGQTVRGKIGTTSGHDAIRESVFVPRASSLKIELVSGIILTMEIGTLLTSVNRPVVYLDQNHWIDLARYCTGSSQISEDRARVCRRITELVEAGKIILPVSGAHLVEIAKKGDRQRRDVAQVMVKHSQGWQMISPLRVRAHELHYLFGSESAGLGKSQVFTLDPDALWADDKNRRRPADRTAGTLPAEIQGLIDRITWAEALLETFVDPEPTVSDIGTEMAEKWANSFQELAIHVRNTPQARPHLRDVTRVRALSDFIQDIARAALAAGWSTEEFQQWWTLRAETEIAAVPMLGRFRELVHLRVSNADDKWHRNDLNDTLFLCTASAYADIVVGEKKMTSYLMRAEGKVPDGARLFRRLEDALPAIETAAA
ncbi:hypothetical protein [Micromonospora noduli]|nr:hypothetical protein [Micromonospora noduli]